MTRNIRRRTSSFSSFLPFILYGFAFCPRDLSFIIESPVCFRLRFLYFLKFFFLKPISNHFKRNIKPGFLNYLKKKFLYSLFFLFSNFFFSLQTDYNRHLDAISESAKGVVLSAARHYFLEGDGKKTIHLLTKWLKFTELPVDGGKFKKP